MAFYQGKTRINSEGDFHTFNIMSALLSDIADLIESIRRSLANSYKGVYSEYVKTLNNLRTFQKLVNEYYGMNLRKVKIFKLKIELAMLYRDTNRLEEGSEMLGDAFGLCLQTLKFKDALFPKKRQSMSFKEFVSNETQ